MQQYNITNTHEKQSKDFSKRLLKADTNFHHEKYKAKVMHGYFTRTLETDQRIDHSSSKSWTKNGKLTSHFKEDISPIQEQEIQQSF